MRRRRRGTTRRNNWRPGKWLIRKRGLFPSRVVMGCSGCVVIPAYRDLAAEALSTATAAGNSGGEDSDWIVANNIMERIALGEPAGHGSLPGGIGAGFRTWKALRRLRAWRRWRLPPSPPLYRGPSALLKGLSPRSASSYPPRRGFPAGSWITTLLDAMTERPPEMRRAEAILVMPSPRGDGPWAQDLVRRAGRSDAGGDRSSPARLSLSPSAAHFR